jgi:large subunit ribosomal protein L5
MANPRVKDRYMAEIVPAMKEKFQYSSVMEVPKLTKIVINKGIGAAVADKKLVDQGVEELSLIAGQKAVATKAKTSVSNKMYEFLDRLMTIALPRVRDFKGINDKGFDGRGNYTLGVTEQIIFPEISIEKVNKISGMDITFVTSAKTDEESYALLKAFGMPFINKNN